MLNSFWNSFVIVLTIGSILACWWLLQWTKGTDAGEHADSSPHVWDEDLVELNSPLPRWWLHLFHITIVFALIYLVLYPGLGNVSGVLGWTQVQQYEAEMSQANITQEAIFSRFRDMSPEQLIAEHEAIEIGRRLFANNCAMCHGSDGRGAPGFPNLADDDWLYGGSFAEITTTLRQGRAGVMPPLGAALGDDGVAEVVAYVQQLSGQQADAALAAAGKTRFDMLCSACHGPNGRGNPLLGAPNLADDIWLYGGSAETIAATINQGRNGKMPAHEHLLNEDRRRLLAGYVMSLSAKPAQQAQ